MANEVLTTVAHLSLTALPWWFHCCCLCRLRSRPPPRRCTAGSGSGSGFCRKMSRERLRTRWSPVTGDKCSHIQEGKRHKQISPKNGYLHVIYHQSQKPLLILLQRLGLLCIWPCLAVSREGCSWAWEASSGGVHCIWPQAYVKQRHLLINGALIQPSWTHSSGGHI